MNEHDRANEALREAMRLIVREQRDRLGMSLRELAEASGVDRMAIQRIEQGGRRTYMDVIPGLSRAFGMGPTDLFGIIYGRALDILHVMQTEDK